MPLACLLRRPSGQPLGGRDPSRNPASNAEPSHPGPGTATQGATAAPMGGDGHDDGGDRHQPLDDLSRLVEPAHLCVTGRKKAVSWHPVGMLLQRSEQIVLACSNRPAKKWPTPIPMKGFPVWSCGLRRKAVSKWSIARGDCPAHSLSQPLRCQPKAKLGFSDTARSINAMAALISSPKYPSV
jgi:hypothetical protein